MAKSPYTKRTWSEKRLSEILPTINSKIIFDDPWTRARFEMFTRSLTTFLAHPEDEVEEAYMIGLGTRIRRWIDFTPSDYVVELLEQSLKHLRRKFPNA